jgi:hypothetical protein
MQSEDISTTAVKVAVRVRPLTPQETGEGSQPAVLVQDELGSISVGSGSSSKSFSCVARPFSGRFLSTRTRF